MRQGGRPRNADWRERSRADSGNCLDRDLMGEGYFDDPSSPDYPGFPEFSSGSNTRSTGRPNSAHPRHPAGDLGTPPSFPHPPGQIGYLLAHQSQDPHEDHIGNRNPDQDNHPRTQSRPNQDPGQTRADGRNENSPVQNFTRRQTYTIGRSSDPGRTDLATWAGRSNTQEHPRQGLGHYPTGEKTNKNGSRKRQERAARGKSSQGH
ncbi:hypothetical protein HOY82DRAFT_554022 [Tuber indicum]|nr:hypothetical protein HOY82DRAFT_554022 [Tuber indicum]